MLPDLVIFSDREYRNNVDIHPDTFYTRLETENGLPTSAHPSLADFMAAFKDVSEYEEILCIVMSSKMTSTINTVKIAAQLLEEDGFAPKIHIYDSYQVSFGMGIAVLDAAKMALSGACAEDIIRHLDSVVPRIGVYFVMQSLKYAYKGGRIGAIKAITADALGVKPLLMFRDGTVSDIALNRNFNDGIYAIFRKYQALAGDDPEVFIFHACNEEGAQKLKGLIQKEFPKIEPQIEWVGPVVGIYTGVGCIGIAFKEKEK